MEQYLKSKGKVLHCVQDNESKEKTVYGLTIMNENFVSNQFPDIVVGNGNGRGYYHKA